MYKSRQRNAKASKVLAFATIALFLAASEARAGETPGAFLVAQAIDKASGEGVVKGVNATERKVQIEHGPIPALQWPAMTMAFDVAPDVDLKGLSSGAKIKFTLSRDAKSLWVIDKIQRVE